MTPIKPDATFALPSACRFGDSNEARTGAGEAGSYHFAEGQLKTWKASYTLNQAAAYRAAGEGAGGRDYRL
ncbi:hypothetical protein LNP74_25950 [Klebsiella pneumoniae subsp. pneumoniae]|nr:hypothetical protein [Klebsiella pneumoniae subsp. pneumoniae]